MLWIKLSLIVLSLPLLKEIMLLLDVVEIRKKRAGSVLVYQRSANDGTWSRVDRLTASDAEAADSLDGQWLLKVIHTFVVSASGVDSSGAVYVFNLDTATNQWKQTAK